MAPSADTQGPGRTVRCGLDTLYVQTGCPELARVALTAAIVLSRAMDLTFWLSQTETALAQVEE
jgi:hypothetical protein